MRKTIHECAHGRLTVEADLVSMETHQGRIPARSNLAAGDLTLDTGAAQLTPEALTVTQTPNGSRIECVFASHGRLAIDLEPVRFPEGALVRLGFAWTGAPPAGSLLRWRWRLGNTSAPFFMIPGVLYGTNHADRPAGRQPKLAYRRPDAALPASACWRFRADRSPCPFVGATFDGHFVALAVHESHQADNGAWGYNSLGLETREDGDAMEIILGDFDSPARPVAHDWTDGPVREGLAPSHDGPLRAEGFLAWSPAPNRYAYEPLHRFLYAHWHQPPRRVAGWRRALADIARPLGQEAICPDTGFYYTVLPDSGAVAPVTQTLIGFIGILQIAQPALEAARMLNDTALADTTAAMIDRVVREAPNPRTGFLFDGFDEGRWRGNYWLPGEPHTAYANGHASYFLARAALAEKARGVDRSPWRATAERIVRLAVKAQADDGHFPVALSTEDGSVIDMAGLSGAWFAAATALMAKITGCRELARSAAAGAQAYARDISTLDVLGAPFDIDKAPDEEGSLAVIKTLRLLHEITGDDRALEMLDHALEYAFTWKFAYNTRHRAGKVNWSSAGGDITSTHNIHIHPMGNLVAEDIHYAWRMTKRPDWRDRLDDTLLWGLQIHNRFDGEFGFGRTGWISEQLYHTAVRYQPGEEDGGAWLAFLPWGSGCILSGLTDGIPETTLDEIAPPMDGPK